MGHGKPGNTPLNFLDWERLWNKNWKSSHSLVCEAVGCGNMGSVWVLWKWRDCAASLETKAAKSGTTQRKSVPDAMPHRDMCDTWPLSANLPKNIRGWKRTDITERFGHEQGGAWCPAHRPARTVFTEELRGYFSRDLGVSVAWLVMWWREIFVSFRRGSCTPLI